MPTSRGAGVAKKGFDYAIYRKGGGVKKYQEGGAVEDNTDMTFGQAFRKARKSGDSTFSWRGKKYTTKLKDESPKVRMTSRDMSESEREAEFPSEAVRPRPAAPASAPKSQDMPRNRFIDMLPVLQRPRIRPSTPAAKKDVEDTGTMYQKGGSVKKYATGGSVCRGMGAATKGGKYSIR